MSQILNELKYCTSHEWVSVEDGIATVGISDHAQEALGDVVFVELPEVDAEVDATQEIAVVESVKAASDIYSPVTGVVVEVNTLLEDEPETVNASPYGDGWFFKIKLADESELDGLLSGSEYAKSVSE